jgi:hypothetical protein
MDPPECSGHSHDHEHAGDDLGLSLRKFVDVDRVTCLNEDVEGSARAVLGKFHEERMSSRPVLLSPPGDPELLLHVPFTEAVTVQSITVRNNHRAADGAVADVGDDARNEAAVPPPSQQPRRIKMFVDRDTMDFDDARDLDAEQELELLPPEHYPDG